MALLPGAMSPIADIGGRMSRLVHVMGLLAVGLAAFGAVVVTADFDLSRDVIGSPGLMGALLVALAPAGRFYRIAVNAAWGWSILFSPVVALAFTAAALGVAELWWKVSLAGGKLALAGAAAALTVHFLRKRARSRPQP
jgi:hypothetical protein